MKKRIFIPLSLGYILLDLFFWAFFVVCFLIFLLPYLDVNCPYKLPTFGAFVYLSSVLVVLYSAIRLLLALKINLRAEDIYTYGDMLPKFEKIQYKTSIKYIDIVSVKIIASEKNSKNKRIPLPSRGISSFVANKYFEFLLTNGKKKRICINYYKKSQIIKLLNILNNNMAVSGNVNKLDIDEIMKDWFLRDNPIIKEENADPENADQENTIKETTDKEKNSKIKKVTSKKEKIDKKDNNNTDVNKVKKEKNKSNNPRKTEKTNKETK